MNRLIPSVIMAFVAGASFAHTSDIEVSYTMRSFYQNGKERINTYHLLANNTYSKFYNPRSEEIDSLTSTPAGLANFKKTQEAALKTMISQGSIVVDKLPNKKEKDYVVKSVADSTITVYDMVSNEGVYYTEPFSEMVWEITDSTKNILGYECISAETDYHGRKWTAWFAPDIPVQDGPWKFRGLPGLILEASTDNHTSFCADGIVQNSKEIKEVYGREKYEKQDRKEILRMRRAMVNNPEGALAAKGWSGLVKINSEQSESKNDDYDFIETDYR